MELTGIKLLMETCFVKTVPTAAWVDHHTRRGKTFTIIDWAQSKELSFWFGLAITAKSWLVLRWGRPHSKGHCPHVLLADGLHWLFDPLKGYQWCLTTVDTVGYSAAILAQPSPSIPLCPLKLICAMCLASQKTQQWFAFYLPMLNGLADLLTIPLEG